MVVSWPKIESDDDDSMFTTCLDFASGLDDREGGRVIIELKEQQFHANLFVVFIYSQPHNFCETNLKPNIKQDMSPNPNQPQSRLSRRATSGMHTTGISATHARSLTSEPEPLGAALVQHGGGRL